MALRSKLCIIKVEKSGESFPVWRAYPHRCVSVCVEVKELRAKPCSMTLRATVWTKMNSYQHSLRFSRLLHHWIFLLLYNNISVMEWILTPTVRHSITVTRNETILYVLDRISRSVGVLQTLQIFQASDSDPNILKISSSVIKKITHLHFENNWLVLLAKEKTYLVHTPCENIKFHNILACGTHNNHCALKCYSTALIFLIRVRSFKSHVKFYMSVSIRLLNIALEANVNPMELRIYMSNN
jgi:hypothetical protein